MSGSGKASNLVLGARNLMERADVKKGEDVLLVCEYPFEESAVGAISQAVKERDAVLTTIK